MAGRLPTLTPVTEVEPSLNGRPPTVQTPLVPTTDTVAVVPAQVCGVPAAEKLPDEPAIRTVPPAEAQVPVPVAVNDPEVPAMLMVPALPTQVWVGTTSTMRTQFWSPPEFAPGWVTERLDVCASLVAMVVKAPLVGSYQRRRTGAAPAIAAVSTTIVRLSGK